LSEEGTCQPGREFCDVQTKRTTPDLWSWLVSGGKPGKLQDRPTRDSFTWSFTWPLAYRCSAGHFHHCDKQAAFCSHRDFQMSGILKQEKPYLSRAYFYGMYYEKGSLGNSKSPECLLK